MAKPSKIEIRVRERIEALNTELAEVDKAIRELTEKQTSLVEQIANLRGILDQSADEGDGNGEAETP